MKNIVSLTGIIGSGKTMASNYFAQLGVTIIDTDSINSQLISGDLVVSDMISKHFGTEFIQEGQLNRSRMRELIFNDSNAKTKLENILYPFINKVSQQLIEKSTSLYCIVVVPLLFKSLYYIKQSNLNIVLKCPTHSLYTRLMDRSNLDRTMVDKIIASQTPQIIQNTLADYILYNNQDPQYLQDQVTILHYKILTRLKLKQ